MKIMKQIYKAWMDLDAERGHGWHFMIRSVESCLKERLRVSLKKEIGVRKIKRKESWVNKSGMQGFAMFDAWFFLSA